jgi:hypothetical protein
LLFWVSESASKKTALRGRVGRGKVEVDVPDVGMIHVGFGWEFGG